MKHSMVIVCPKCKKEVSEFALICSNCGCSLEKQPPLKVDATTLKQKPTLHTTRAVIWGITLSAAVGALSLFVLTQALLAFKIVRGMATINGLVLFHDAVEQLSLSHVSIGIIVSAVMLIASLAVILFLVIKVVRTSHILAKQSRT